MDLRQYPLDEYRGLIPLRLSKWNEAPALLGWAARFFFFFF